MNVGARSDIGSVVLFSNTSLIFLVSFPVALINNLLLRCDGKITHTSTHTHIAMKKKNTFTRYTNDGCHGDQAWLCL